MTISPSSMNPKDNMKSREVYCSKCKEYWFSKETNPNCELCGEVAITVVHSMFDKTKITGNDGLVKSNS